MTSGEIEHLKLLGATDEQLEVLAAGLAPEAEDFVLWPENRRVFEFFISCDTQWRWSSSSAAAGSLMKGFQSQSAETPIGLDWAGVAAVAAWQGITLPDRPLFDALKTCERAYLAAHRDRKKGRRG